MSLTTKSYEMTSGFTAMTADELFFINGGSGSKSSSANMSSSSSNLSSAQKVGTVMAQFGKGMQDAATLTAPIIMKTPGGAYLTAIYGSTGVALEKAGEAIAKSSPSGK